MNLQSEISTELWEAVSKSYEGGNHSNAISDAIRYLFDTIREKSGVEKDGHLLVDQSFGGNTPKLQLNKLQTETERMERNGFMEMLKGIYSGLRNPRSHEGRIDSPETAEAIIVFINYLLTVINQAKQPFTVDEWIDRVYDPYFDEDPEYAEALVAEIPPRKRFDTLINLYQSRNVKAQNVLRYVFEALYKVLEETQIKEFLRTVSGELKKIRDTNDIRLHLVILRPEFWLELDKVSKMRIEKIMTESIAAGGYIKSYDEDFAPTYKCTGGKLATWAVGFMPYFLSRYGLSWKLLEMLNSEELAEQNYVAEFFLSVLPKIVDDMEKDMFIDNICRLVIEAKGISLLATKLAKGYFLPPTWTSSIMEKLQEKDMSLYTKLFPPDIELRDEDIPF